MTLHDIIASIEAGKFDKDLAKIQTALANRRSVMSIDAFNIGDRVVFNDQCGTRYLVGQTAVVTGMKRSKIVVELDRPIGRFVRYSNGQPISASIVVPTGIVDYAA